MLKEHRQFWIEHPVLSIGISFAIGIGISIFSFSLWIFILWNSYCLVLKKWASFTFVFFAWVYGSLLFKDYPMIENPLPCKAYFSIHSIQNHQTPFHKSLLYKGTLHLNQNRLPCAAIFSKNPPSPQLKDLYLEGVLTQQGRFSYQIKPKKWTYAPHSFTLAPYRYLLKQSVKQFINSKFSKKTAPLLASLITGELEDRLLRFEFSRVGLQHLLAISGFHFGILIAFATSFFGLFLPCKWKWGALFISITLYYLFIGPSPSVQRTSITLSLFFLAKVLKRPILPINLLGAAFFIELIFNPLIVENIGFQLSFASCLGILFLYQPLESIFQIYFPKRSFDQTSKFSLAEKITYLFSNFFRSALSLNIAISIILTPLLLYHFHKFPLLSLLFNLIFPLAIGVVMSLFLHSLLIYFLIPIAGNYLFKLVDLISSEFLQMTTYPPFILDYSIYKNEFNSIFIPFYYFFILFLKLKFFPNSRTTAHFL